MLIDPFFKKIKIGSRRSPNPQLLLKPSLFWRLCNLLLNACISPGYVMCHAFSTMIIFVKNFLIETSDYNYIWFW